MIDLVVVGIADRFLLGSLEIARRRFRAALGSEARASINSSRVGFCWNNDGYQCHNDRRCKFDNRGSRFVEFEIVLKVARGKLEWK